MTSLTYILISLLCYKELSLNVNSKSFINILFLNIFKVLKMLNAKVAYKNINVFKLEYYLAK